ncbi:uncharacterized protein TNCV_2935571 [Trichonephila clavipes]|nr:uncharacterized protein TNCV_2935571 [Trichonephila clavipes]
MFFKTVDTKLHQISNVSKNKFFNEPFDVSMRIVQDILSLGLGYSALEKFCMHMNLSIMVREAYGSKNDKDIVDIGVSYEMEAD